jgi:hypothetical protein
MPDGACGIRRIYLHRGRKLLDRFRLDDEPVEAWLNEIVCSATTGCCDEGHSFGRSLTEHNAPPVKPARQDKCRG